MATVTSKQMAAGYQMVVAVGQAIKALQRVPSGHLYAHLMGSLTLDEYQTIIGLLKKAGVVREECDELIWNAPA